MTKSIPLLNATLLIVTLLFTAPSLCSAAEDGQRAKWQSLFDGKTLGKWKPAKFGGEGEVSVKEGVIHMQSGNTLTGITYAGKVPTTNYEIEVEARRWDGIDFFCGLTFPVAKSHCSFIPGGWGGATVGLSSIDGKDASENDTTGYYKFEDRKWYTIRVRVEPERIRVWLDKKKLVDQNIKGKKISIRPEVDLSRPLGISAWQTAAEVRKIRLRRIDEK